MAKNKKTTNYQLPHYRRTKSEYHLNPLDWLFAMWYFSWFRWCFMPKEPINPQQEAELAYSSWCRSGIIPNRWRVYYGINPESLCVGCVLAVLVSLPFAYFFRSTPWSEHSAIFVGIVFLIILVFGFNLGGKDGELYFTRPKVHKLSYILSRRHPNRLLATIYGIILIILNIFVFSLVIWPFIIFRE